ncbi:unnamed protein product [Phytophthora fragariaefolia]|uniref:Unnamed protein product n=1 Tax=Phytophthora fragariaefolia TaxID=1490495 RepID=A0A9W6YI13_9STRA|nr:unnamed protein product [Phytophthora fragariaefolia]
MVLARDELEALFDVGSDADMEDGEEEDEGTSSSTLVGPSVGSRRPREDNSDASSLKRSRSGSDRPLADAGPLSSPGSPCEVPMGIACERCHVGAVRVSELDNNGYTGVRVLKELKPLRTNLIAQMSSSAARGRSTLTRAVGAYSSRSSFTPFGGFGGGGLRTPPPFPERPASGRSAAPTYRGSEEILTIRK